METCDVNVARVAHVQGMQRRSEHLTDFSTLSSSGWALGRFRCRSGELMQPAPKQIEEPVWQ